MLYRELSIWERRANGLWRFRVLENVESGRFSVQSRDFFGAVGDLKDLDREWPRTLDRYFVELLAEQDPEERAGGGSDSIAEAIQKFDEN